MKHVSLSRLVRFMLLAGTIHLFLLFHQNAAGQGIVTRDSLKSDVVYAQSDVSFGMVSLQYERLIVFTPYHNSIVVSAGVSHSLPFFNQLEYDWAGVPLWISLYTGDRLHHFETGLGYWPAITYNRENRPYFTSRFEQLILLKAGYRRQHSTRGGLVLKAGLEAGISVSEAYERWVSGMLVSPYISAGYSF